MSRMLTFHPVKKLNFAASTIKSCSLIMTTWYWILVW